MPRTLVALLTALWTALPLVALAQQATPAEQERRDAAKAKWQSMTPEQQAAAKERAKAHWDAKTPEEQEAAKKRFHERHPNAGRRSGAAAAAPTPAAPAAASAPSR
jgi:hypothetical protein